MGDHITYVGLDVHKDGIVVAVAEGGLRGEVRDYGRIANTPALCSGWFACSAIKGHPGRQRQDRARDQASDRPRVNRALVAATTLAIERIGLESGCTAAWLFAGLQRHGWPVICIDARHAAAALQAGFRNKNDRNDAAASPI